MKKKEKVVKSLRLLQLTMHFVILPIDCNCVVFTRYFVEFIRFPLRVKFYRALL